MKTGFKQLTAFLFLVVFFAAGNLNAKGTEVTASSQIETETTMELENWMVNKFYWSETSMTTIEESQECCLQLETWMTDENVWKTPVFAEIVNDSETELTLKNWMTEENIWNR